MDIASRETWPAASGPAGFRLDTARGVLLRPDGSEAPLRPKTAEVLRHLASSAGRMVPRAELLDAVWPGLFVTDDSVTQCIAEARRALGAAGRTLLRTLPRRGYMLAAPLELVQANAGEGATPVLAVLPFDNLSADRRWDRLCDGLVEDLITDFARQPALRVIARTSSFAWRGKPADIREIGRALGARYLLEGSVQAEAGRIVVTAQLIESVGGTHVWARRYAREEAAFFDIQADLVERVVGALGGLAGGIARHELARARRAPPGSLKAYELYLLGYEQEARLDREGTLRGLELLEAAVAADPSLSRAWTVLAFALGNAAGNGWGDDVAALRARQAEAIRRALELDPEDGLALEELGAKLAREGDIAGASAAFRRAAAAGAGHADTLSLLGKYMVEVLGEAGPARDMTARAFVLNPFAPGWYWLGATRVAFFSRDFARAVDCARRAPAMRLPRLIEVLALAQLGAAAEADAALREHRERFGEGGVAGAVAALTALCPPARALLEASLAKAGLPVA